MLSRRVIVCLDVQNGRVVKGVHFVNLEDVGDPAELAARYEREGADEVVFLNIAATNEDKRALLDTVRAAADRLFIPMTVGGGVATVKDAHDLLRAGADKVSINSAAVRRPEIITEASEQFGAQCVVASIDAKRDGRIWRVFTRGGRHPEELDAVEWAEQCQRLGAGEILLTSIDRDGTRAGYDVELTRAVAQVVDIPVVASGGGGLSRHVIEVLATGSADAALVAGALHDRTTTVTEIKDALSAAGIPVRVAA